MSQRMIVRQKTIIIRTLQQFAACSHPCQFAGSFSSAPMALMQAENSSLQQHSFPAAAAYNRRYFSSSSNSDRTGSYSSDTNIDGESDIHTGGSEPDLEFFDGYYFDGEIPRDRISQKWAKASGAGGMNVNANDTKAVIRFDLKTADWIPERVRNRMAQKYCTSMNARGEFIVTSMATRSAIENMEDCYSKLREQLREVSLELVKERRREYISPEYAMELENRKSKANHFRVKNKKRNSEKKQNRRGAFL